MMPYKIYKVFNIEDFPKDTDIPLVGAETISHSNIIAAKRSKVNR